MTHGLIRRTSSFLPPRLRRFMALIYRSFDSESRAVYDIRRVAPSPAEVERRFVEAFFDTMDQYEELSEEFDNSVPVKIYSEYEDLDGAREAVYDGYDEPDEQHSRKYWAGIKLLEGRALYTLLRKLNPSVLVETGVANGWSTTCILAALEKNDTGTLYSVDYPVRSERGFEAYSDEHFFGNAKIPTDKETGWLVPGKFRHRWDLRLGRSQRLLPELLTELGRIDYFHHDSEHSDPCMMFEYELGWEFLDQGGILVSDDMNPSLAWEVFADVRAPSSTGLLAYPNQGYMVK